MKWDSYRRKPSSQFPNATWSVVTWDKYVGTGAMLIVMNIHPRAVSRRVFCEVGKFVL
jgi:hypothetical protein